jgi:hypothetical protein
MEKLLAICGSPDRAAAIFNAANEVVGAGLRVTIETLSARLPEAKFPGLLPLAQDEADAAFEAIEEAANAHAAALEEPPPEPDDSGAVAAEAPAAPKLSPAEAMEAKRLAEIELAEARGDLMAATTRRQLARHKLAQAVSAWQRGLPTVTREEAAKAVIATQRADRAARVVSGNPFGARPGPSYVDRMRFYRNKGDASDFLRKQMQRAHGKFTRGDRMLPDGRIVTTRRDA